MSIIGAEQTWQETNDQVYDNFATTGDWMLNSAPDLETVINAGVCAQARHTDCLLMQLLTDRHCNLRWRRRLHLQLHGRGSHGMLLLSIIRLNILIGLVASR